MDQCQVLARFFLVLTYLFSEDSDVDDRVAAKLWLISCVLPLCCTQATGAVLGYADGDIQVEEVSVVTAVAVAQSTYVPPFRPEHDSGFQHVSAHVVIRWWSVSFMVRMERGL